MKSFRRFVSSWQGWLAGLVATVVYFFFPALARILDPTAGEFPPAFDVGLLQLVALAGVIYFVAVAVVWSGWQLAFRSLDRLYDREIERLYEDLPPWLSVLMIQGSFVVMALGWVWAVAVAMQLNGKG